MSLFVDLAQASVDVKATRKRKEKVAIIAACLGALDETEVAAAASFLAGRLRQGRLGVGYRTLFGAKQDINPAGEATLSVLDVDGVFDRVKNTSGTGSAKTKKSLLNDLLSRATKVEQEYLRSLLVQEVRQGALESLLLEGLAVAGQVPVKKIRRARMLAGALDEIAQAALRSDEAALDAFDLQLFRPVEPMLASPCASAAEALARHAELFVEHKIDGARVQVHRRGDEVRVYTRQLNDVTASVDEVVEAALQIDADDFVLDGEAIGLQPDGRPAAFQTTMQRFGRRQNIEAMKAQIPLSVFFFDLLYLNGLSLLDAPNAERIKALHQLVPSANQLASVRVDNEAAIDAVYDKALAAGQEGLVMKAVDAPYDAGRRGKNWLKLKPAHTFDLVVLAAEWGSGRRQGWLSNLHLGARDGDRFVMLGKTFKGLSDDLLAWQTEALQARVTRTEGHVVFVRPELVIEVALDGVQRSPHYPGGIALRFARVRRYRPDKTPAEADTLTTLRKLAPSD